MTSFSPLMPSPQHDGSNSRQDPDNESRRIRRPSQVAQASARQVGHQGEPKLNLGLAPTVDNTTLLPMNRVCMPDMPAARTTAQPGVYGKERPPSAELIRDKK